MTHIMETFPLKDVRFQFSAKGTVWTVADFSAQTITVCKLSFTLLYCIHINKLHYYCININKLY